MRFIALLAVITTAAFAAPLHTIPFGYETNALLDLHGSNVADVALFHYTKRQEVQVAEGLILAGEELAPIIAEETPEVANAVASVGSKIISGVKQAGSVISKIGNVASSISKVIPSDIKTTITNKLKSWFHFRRGEAQLVEEGVKEGVKLAPIIAKEIPVVVKDGITLTKVIKTAGTAGTVASTINKILPASVKTTVKSDASKVLSKLKSIFRRAELDAAIAEYLAEQAVDLD